MGRLAVSSASLGARTFAEVWNGERFRKARSLFRHYGRSGEGPEPICYDCPVVKDWDRWSRHRARGGSLATFGPGYTVNDGFNFFFNRRPARS